MPIHLTLQNTGTSNPIFKERDIPSQMPGAIGEIPVYAFPGEKKVAYDTMLTILPAVLYAQVTGTGTFAPKDNIAIFNKINDFPGLRFAPPTGYFTFSGLSEDQKNSLEAAGLILEPSKPATYVGCPSFESMATVFGLEPQSSRIPPDYASADAIFAYSLLIKGMAFYSTASHSLAYSSIPLLVSTDKKFASDKGKVTVEYGATRDTIDFSLDSVGWTLLSSTRVVPVAMPIDRTRKFTKGITTSVAPKIVKVDVGGRFFPYFHNMVLPDRTFCFEVFADIFFSCLADDPTVVPEILNRLRRGNVNLARTEAGMALSHAYMGIKLSKQAHAYLTFVVTKGVYQGFVLEGDFKVVIGGRSYSPKTSAEVVLDIENSNKHEKTLQEICTLFELAKSSAKTTLHPTTIEDINTSRKFLRHYKLIQINEYAAFPDFSKDLRKLVGKLAYNEVFEPLNLGSLKTFLRYVQTEDESLLDNLPAWLDGYFEKCGSIVATGLGIFGNVALSVSYGGENDQKFTIPSELGAVDPNLGLKSDGSRVLPYLPIKKVEINKALGHWNRLFETGTFQIPPGRKGKKEFTNQQHVLFDIGGAPNFPEVYGMIKDKVLSSKVGRRKRAQAEVSGSTAGGASKKSKGKGKATLGAL